MSRVVRAWRVAELVALRLRLPARLSKQSLDELLFGLTPKHGAIAGKREKTLIARDLLRAEGALARLPWVETTCLYRAMARYGAMRRTGVEAAFVMGLRGLGLEANGHAWVEVDGKPFEESEDVARYTVTFRYPRTLNSDRQSLL